MPLTRPAGPVPARYAAITLTHRVDTPPRCGDGDLHDLFHVAAPSADGSIPDLCGYRLSGCPRDGCAAGRRRADWATPAGPHRRHWRPQRLVSESARSLPDQVSPYAD